MIHLMDPHNLEEIVKSVNEIGKVIEKEKNAIKITEAFKNRIDQIRKHKPMVKPKVLALEWIEPFFTAGHWIPEMVNDAGGENLISKEGEHSRKIGIDEIIRSDPDIIVMMPCGFDTFRTISEYNRILKTNKSWNSLRAVKNRKVFAVDANSISVNQVLEQLQG